MGDPACFLDATCLSCGRFVETRDGDDPTCPYCGGPLDGTPPPLAGVRTVNTILYCARWSETVAFYRRVLRLDIAFENDWFVEFTFGPHASVSVADASRATVGSIGGRGITLSMRVDDLSATRRRLESAGAEPSEVRVRFGSEVFDVVDPEGNRLELWSGPTPTEDTTRQGVPGLG